MDPGVLPPPYFEFGKARHQAPTSVRDPDVAHAEAATSSVSTPAPPEDPNAAWKQLTKKQRKAVRYVYHLTDMAQLLHVVEEQNSGPRLVRSPSTGGSGPAPITTGSRNASLAESARPQAVLPERGRREQGRKRPAKTLCGTHSRLSTVPSVRRSSNLPFPSDWDDPADYHAFRHREYRQSSTCTSETDFGRRAGRRRGSAELCEKEV